MASDRPRRAWIVDPSLESTVGHHLTYARVVVDQARRRGLEPTVLSHRNLRPDVDVGAPVVPTFSHSVYDSLFHSSDGLELDDFVFLNREFAQELTTALPAVGPGDIVVCPQLRQQQLVGLADWLSALERPLPPVIVALLSGPEFVPTHLRANAELCDVRLGADAYRVGFARLFDVHGGGVRYLTETCDLAEAFADLGAWPVDLCHINSPYDSVDPLAIRRPGTRIRVAYVGEAREEKGFHLLPAVVTEVLCSALPVEFSIQVWGDLATPALAEAGRLLVRTARADDRVRVFEQVFDRDECLAFQRAGDITLLPYDATWYRDRAPPSSRRRSRRGYPWSPLSARPKGPSSRRRATASCSSALTAPASRARSSTPCAAIPTWRPRPMTHGNV